MKIEVGEIWRILKEASTKPGESIEGEIETFQGGQVLELVALQPREKVVAEDMMFAIVIGRKEKRPNGSNV